MEKVFLTGRPGIGKTTVLNSTIKLLKETGLKIGGMTSCEVREKGERIGFQIVDLKTGKKGWLAHIKQPIGPRISKYRVNMKDLEEIGVRAIEEAIKHSEMVIIDEVGPMELFSRKFKDAVSYAIQEEKPVLGTIHWKTKDPLIDFIKSKARIFEVTIENRERLPTIIFNEFMKCFSALQK